MISNMYGINEMNSVTIEPNSSIEQVLRKIDENGKGMLFVVDGNNKLLGVITDGDVRRLLLKGYGLNFSIDGLYNDEFCFLFEGEAESKISNMDSQYISRLVPIINVNGILTGYIDNSNRIAVALAKPQMSGNEYNYLVDAFLSTWISSTGKYISSFEESFSKYCGVKYGVATSNGTTALHLALAALGITKGDEVIVPDLTFAATINSVLYTGATPIIVDIEEDGWCISPDAIKNAITSKTKAIIVVHLYGQPCQMDEISRIANENNIFIIEDCAEAHGAMFDNKRVGSFGDIACFSFFGNKVITTGEGGMCLTNDEILRDKMQILRDHGMSRERKYYHEVIGFNYRMTNMQAAIGTAQVERIDEILEWRKRLEERYAQSLAYLDNVKLQRRDLKGRTKIAWLVSILVPEEKRDKIINSLKSNEIDVRAFFVPLSEMEIYKNYSTKCIVSKKISKMGINLPTTYEVDDEIIKKIAHILELT